MCVHHGLSLILGYLKKLQPTQLDKSPVCTPLPHQESNQVSEDGGRLTQDVTGTLRPLSQKDTFRILIWVCLKHNPQLAMSMGKLTINRRKCGIFRQTHFDKMLANKHITM